MSRKKLLVVVGAVALVAIATGGGVAIASGSDEAETPITGDALTRASAAALAATGGGTVTATEVGDEESYYQVEVKKPDGSSVDVQLDEAFHVVGSAADVEDANGD